MKFSVIIPTYNRMNSLPKSVESVLNQTFTDFELIIVDDCSTDTTKEYIDSLKDERIRYYKNDVNKGVAVSRNVGASMAQGEYLAFHDSDDEWVPEKLAKVYDFLMGSASKNYDLIFHQMREYFGNEMTIVPTLNLNDFEKEFYTYNLCFPVVGPPAAVIKKDVFLTLDGFCVDCHSLEDYEFFLRVAKRYNVAYLPEPLTIVYDSPDSVNKRFKDKIDTELYIVGELFDDYIAYGLLEKKISLVHMQALNYDCEEYFFGKAMDLYATLSEEKKELLLACIEMVGTKKQEASNDLSSFYREAAGQLAHICDSLKRLQNNAKNSPQILVQSSAAIVDALKGVVSDVYAYAELTTHPYVTKNKFESLGSELAGANCIGTKLKNVLDSCVAEIEKMLADIGMSQYACSFCQKEVKMLPLLPFRKVMRDKFGFLNADLVYPFENENADCCPVCGANAEQRFVLSFLDDVQPEEGEKLAIRVDENADIYVGAAANNSENMAAFVKSYAEYRENAFYEENEMSKVDVLICSGMINSVKCIDEWIESKKSQLKPQGVVILTTLVEGAGLSLGAGVDEKLQESVSEIESQGETKKSLAIREQSWSLYGRESVCQVYNEQELIDLFEKHQLTTTVVDINWFGEEFYEQFAYPKTAKLYMLSAE